MGAAARWLVLVAVLLTACGVVTACGAGPRPGSGVAGSAPPPDPLALVGRWQVAGSSATVVVDPSSLRVRDGCGWVDARWRGDAAGRFLARVTGVAIPSGVNPPDSCPAGAPGPGEPRWLSAAAGFATDGADRLLRDRTGAEVLRLRPVPPGTPADVDPVGDAPDPGRAPTADERAAAAAAAPVPAGMRPAGPAALIGRWRAGRGAAFVEFGPSGTWTGSDGCNGTDGTWLASPDGGFLAVAAGTTTLIACDDAVPVGDLLSSTRRVALDDTTVLLLDVTGRPVGRLARA